MLVNDVVLDDKVVAFLGPEVRFLTVKRTIAETANYMVLEVGNKTLYGMWLVRTRLLEEMTPPEALVHQDSREPNGLRESNVLMSLLSGIEELVEWGAKE